MPPQNLFEPLTLFLIWYIIPGYLSLAIFISWSKALQPTLKFSWKKIKYFDKIIFSIIISTIIFYSYFYYTKKNIVDILKISSNDLMLIIGISLIFSIIFAVILSFLIILLNDYLLPFYYLLIYLPIKRFIFKKDIDVIFFEDFYYTGVRGMGIIYDLLLNSINDAYNFNNKIKVKLKSTKEIKEGNISLIKRDLSEFGVEKGNEIVIIKTDDVLHFTYKENKLEVKKHEINQMKKRTWWIIIIFLLLSLLLFKFIPYLIVIPIFFLIIKCKVLDKWEKDLS